MNNNTFVHKYIRNLVSKNDIVVDMTVGNGNDALFLGRIAKEVIGFDINKQAIKNTLNKTKELNNVKLINDNHINIDKYINSRIRLFVFNLGYLPNSQDLTTTKKDETLIAFKKAYSLLEDNGYIIITFYLGHIGGKDEYYLLKDYLSNNHIKVLEQYRAGSKADEPITYVIKKRKTP